MASVLKRVGASFDERSLAGRVDKHDCKLCLKGIPEPVVIVDLDRDGAPFGCDETQCDYLVFVDGGDQRLVFLPLELKRSWRDKAVTQLQACAAEVEKHVPTDIAMRCRPIVACRRFSPKGWRAMVRHPIQFRGHLERIHILRCGDDLIRGLGS